MRAIARGRSGLAEQALILIGLTGLLVLARALGRTPLHLPGHAGLFWIPVLLIARSRLNKPGTSLAISAVGGILATRLLGAGLSGLVGLAAAGLALELLAVLLGSFRSLPSALLAGAGIHLAKLGAKLALLGSLGLPDQALAAGLTYCTALHLGFGLVGGMIAWGVIRIRPGRNRRLLMESL